MATNTEVIKKLQDELTEMNVSFTQENTVDELKAILKNAKAEAKKLEEKPDVILWVKNTSYINDKERVSAGVYLVKDVPERLAKLSQSNPNAVEIIESPTTVKIADLAKWAGMDTKGFSKDEEYVDLLSKITKELSTF